MCTKCSDCFKMISEEEGLIPKEYIEYDFAEDALDFEIQLAETREVKYTEQLTEPLNIGAHVVCTGTPSEDLPWFTINLGCGNPEGRAEVAVHFNVRLPQRYVVRNTRRHDKWGPEETAAHRRFPFKSDQPFTIEVIVDENETLWAVDGAHYCSYAHRSPSAVGATWVQVNGVRDASLEVRRADVYPLLAPPPLQVPFRDSESAPAADAEPSWSPNVFATLSEGIPEGHQLVVCGRLRPLLHSFAIDLLDEPREWPRPQLLLHVNVRAHVQADQPRQLVVFNTWLGAWGPERRQRTARLVPGDETTFRIVRDPAEWTVFADGVLIGELEHRAAPAGVRALRLRGDLYPSHVYVCPTSSSPVEGPPLGST